MLFWFCFIYHFYYLWYEKVHDTFAITLHDLVKTLEELNSIDNSIDFTMESAKDRKVAFLVSLIRINENRIKNWSLQKTNTYGSVHSIAVQRVFLFRLEKIIRQKACVSTLVPRLQYITYHEFQRSLGTKNNICSFKKLKTFFF